MAEGELGVEVLGKGRDIVLLHSLLTDSSSFVSLARLLSGERRVSLVDLPGFGSSPPAAPLAGFADRIAKYCEMLAAKPDIIGNGLGSFVALTLAARHGAGSAGWCSSARRWRFPNRAGRLFAALPTRLSARAWRPVADIAMARMFSEDFIAANPTIVAERKAIFLRIDPAVFAAAARALATLDLSADLASIRNPVLIVTGEKDGATPPALGRALAERLPDARFVELTGVGHAPHIQALDLTIATIAPFLGLRETTGG